MNDSELEEADFLKAREIEVGKKIEILNSFIKKFNWKKQDIVWFAASQMLNCEELSLENSELMGIINSSISAFMHASVDKNGSFVFKHDGLTNLANEGNITAKKLLEYAKANKSQKASAAAKAGHKATYELRDEVIRYWNESIDTKLSAERAANILVMHFPLSHRILAGYVTAEKKLRRASKT